MKLFKNKIFKNKSFLSIILALFIFIVIGSVNLNLVNKSFQKYFNQEGYNDDRIVVVKIDNTTTKFLNEKFPFDRKTYINLIKNLNKAGATTIGFDIIFADPTKSDQDFGKAIKDAGNIVLGSSSIRKTTLGVFELPQSSISSGALLIGGFDVKQDSTNNIVFSVSPYKNFSNGYYEYFGVTLLRAYYSKVFNDKSFLTEKLNINEKYLNIKDNITLPLSRKNTNDFFINYNSQHVKTFSFNEIYDDKQFLITQNNEGNDFLKNKIVIVGAALEGLDKVKTPIGDDYGVFIHANFLNTVLTKNFSIYFDKNLEYLLIYLLIILSIYINLAKSGKILILSNIAIVGIIFLYFSVIKDVFSLILNYPFEIILGFLLSIIISNITKYILENKEKNKLYSALSGYVSKEVAQEIVSGEGNINLEGEKKRISIFFSDIEGFTSISEKYTPEKLISFLKEYLTEMSEIIFEHKGFINKYEGDAIMALRGVSGKEKNLAESACETALLQKHKLIELNKKWATEGIPEIKVRIGINIGDAILGNIGGKKIEFTAIGDSVNLASRLESINKFYSTYLCVSESIYQETKDLYEYRYLDKIRVKGKEIALNIYELIDYKGTIGEDKKSIISEFEKGISLYNNRDFEASLNIFDKLSKKGDSPSLVYKERCQIFIKNPPDENWDKVWTMIEK